MTHGFEVAFYVLAGLMVAGAAIATAFIESQPPVPQEEVIDANIAMEVAA